MRSIKDYLVSFILLLAMPLGAETLLSEYLATAAENNPGLKSAFADYLAAVEKVPQVGSLPDPVAAFGYFASPTETRVGPVEAKISLSQKFPWFGLLDAREDVASEQAKVLLEGFEEQKSKLLYDVKTAYYDLYIVASATAITQENGEILETLRQLALIKLESGKASAVDELRVEMDVADLDNEIAHLEDQRYELQVRFNQLLNVDAEREVILPELLWEETLIEDRVGLFASIVENNHSIQQIEHKALSWKHQKEVAKKEGKVDFDVGIDYSFVGSSRMSLLNPAESGQDTIAFPKIGISIPIYRKKYRAMVAEASQMVTASTFEKADRMNQLRSLFEDGYKKFRDGRRRVDLYTEQRSVANDALDLLLATYSTDGSNFEEVLRMERRVLSYGLALDRARSDRNAAVAFIEYLQGI